MRELLDSDSPSWFPSRVNPYAGSLARRLCERTADSRPQTFFASSGSEAVEAALKLARAVTGGRASCRSRAPTTAAPWAAAR